MCCCVALIHVAMQQHWHGWSWREQVKCWNSDNPWSPYDSDPSQFFFVSIQLWSLWQEKTQFITHTVAPLFPSGSFPQMILHWVPMCLENKHLFKVMMTLTEERKGEASEILLPRGLAYFIAISSAGPSTARQLFPTIAPTLILSLLPDLPRVWTLNSIFIWKWLHNGWQCNWGNVGAQI